MEDCQWSVKYETSQLFVFHHLTCYEVKENRRIIFKVQDVISFRQVIFTYDFLWSIATTTTIGDVHFKCRLGTSTPKLSIINILQSVLMRWLSAVYNPERQHHLIECSTLIKWPCEGFEQVASFYLLIEPTCIEHKSIKDLL